MSEVEVESHPPQPEVKRGRGRPTGSLSKTPKKPIDEDYHKKYYLNKVKPVFEAKEAIECEYCNKKIKRTTIRSHNTSSFCSKYLRNKTQ